MIIVRGQRGKKKMNSEVIIEVLDRLIGSIQPYGSTQIDVERMENLEILLEVMDEYINEIRDVAKYRNRHEYSILAMADRAYDWLVGLRDYVDEIVREYADEEEKEIGE